MTLNSNEAQRRMLLAHGLTEATLSSARPELRLLWDELGSVADAPKPDIAATVNRRAAEFLAGRDVDSLDALDREMFDYLSSSPYFADKPEAVAPDASTIAAPPTGPMRLDPNKVAAANLNAMQRLLLTEAADYVANAKSGRFASSPASLEQAELRLKPYMSAAA